MALSALSSLLFLRAGSASNTGAGRAAGLPAPRQAPSRHLHLRRSPGTRGCKAELLADFLACNSCETLYLVGDIIDGWQAQTALAVERGAIRVIAEILHKADTGTRVIYLPGNHDEFLRPYCGRVFAGIEIVAKQSMRRPTASACSCCTATSSTACSVAPNGSPILGDTAYCFTLALNDRLHALRRRLACRIGRSPPISKERSRTRSSTSRASRKWSPARQRPRASTA